MKNKLQEAMERIEKTMVERNAPVGSLERMDMVERDFGFIDGIQYALYVLHQYLSGGAWVDVGAEANGRAHCRWCKLYKQQGKNDLWLCGAIFNAEWEPLRQDGAHADCPAFVVKP